MATVEFFKVNALPAPPLAANAIYFVVNGDYAEAYVTSNTGVAKSMGNSTMIATVAGPLIAAGLAQMNRVEVVDDIAARDALEGNPRNQMVFVKDASDDVSVNAGSALYVFENATDDWYKIAEFESMDFTLSWDGISGKPSSTPTDIDDAVSKRHTHSNKSVLDDIGDEDDLLTYKGEPVASATQWGDTDW